ncbi:MAG: cytochrome ubiquinol oxidase subunit I [Myxococcales bacterium]|nr:cytochrome ubiquinol oxidase subunit I [Myxococcales bacterium]
MTDLLAARSQMAISLGFHILFAVAGMAMPLFMVVAEWRHLRTGDAVYRELAQRWAKGTAILFAVGAVSGTVLSFELGLLWPRFMEHAGPLVGLPFSLEGFAFFLEAIFLGVYLYGWDRVAPRVHLLSGVAVAISGVVSGVFVTAVNSWMNTPTGFRLEDGEIVDVNVWAAFFSPAFPTQATHMVLAAYTSVAFIVLGIHAWGLRQEPGSRFHQRAFGIVFLAALVGTPLQVVSGDFAAKHLASHQPTKLAAAEALFETQAGAPLILGGWPDVGTREIHFAIEVPQLLSVLATGDPAGTVLGLEEFPEELWPPVPIVHVAFQVMVACGVVMLLFVLWGATLWWRRRRAASWVDRRFLGAAMLVAPLGLIALEAGWVVTEVGRQPWIVRGFMKTADAVTPMPGLIVPMTAFTLLYLVLGVVVVAMLKAHVFQVSPEGEPARAEAAAEERP